MSPVDPKRATLYKRFERDDEFVVRLRAIFKERKIDDFGTLATKKDKDLDDYAWGAVKVQRKILEDHT